MLSSSFSNRTISSCIESAMRVFKAPKRRNIRNAPSEASHLEHILCPTNFHGYSLGVFLVSFYGPLQNIAGGWYIFVGLEHVREVASAVGRATPLAGSGD